jgi:hypothetical protein
LVPGWTPNLASDFTGANEQTTANEQGQQAAQQLLETDLAADKIAFMRAIRCAVEIRIIFVDARNETRLAMKLSSRFKKNRFSGTLVCDQVQDASALGAGVFRVSVVIVKAGTISQDSIRRSFAWRPPPFRIELQVVGVDG